MQFVPPQQPQTGPFMIDPVQGIRVAQIIWAALIMGVVCFTGVALIMKGEPQAPMIAYLAAGFAAINIGVKFVVPGMIVRTQLQKLPAGSPEDLNARLFPIFQTRMIVGLALLEGAAFFNLIAYLTEKQIWTLGIVGLLVLMMVMMFPTLNQFESWVDDIKRDLASQF